MDAATAERYRRILAALESMNRRAEIEIAYAEAGFPREFTQLALREFARFLMIVAEFDRQERSITAGRTWLKLGELPIEPPNVVVEVWGTFAHRTEFCAFLYGIALGEGRFLHYPSNLLEERAAIPDPRRDTGTSLRYRRTKDEYRQLFECEPPKSIWPQDCWSDSDWSRRWLKWRTVTSKFAFYGGLTLLLLFLLQAQLHLRAQETSIAFWPSVGALFGVAVLLVYAAVQQKKGKLLRELCQERDAT